MLAFCLALVACGRTDPEGASNGSGIDGADLFGKFCASCHGIDGRPDAMMTARLGVRDLTAPELRTRITPELVETQIRTGSPNKLMPSFAGALGEAQMKAIAAYVASAEFLTR